jgi:hypothetical protein
MKILINTISRCDIINRLEIAQGLQPNKKGELKPASKEEQDFAASVACPEIQGEVFPMGEWRHMDEKWIADNADLLAKYPDVKEAHVVLQENMAAKICECGFHHFAKGIEDAATLYKQELPEIAAMVLRIAPVKVG